MADIPELVSERLRLRRWVSSDADALRRIYADPVTMQFIGDGGRPRGFRTADLRYSLMIRLRPAGP